MSWYLLAWDTDKEDWRVFRTDRVTALQRLTSRRSSHAPPPAGTGIDYLRQGFNRHRERVVVTIDAPTTAVAGGFPTTTSTSPRPPDSGTHAVLNLDSWQWLLPSLAFLDADFRVEEPTAFREALKRFGARLGRQ